jgi:hypothetical protein
MAVAAGTACALTACSSSSSGSPTAPGSLAAGGTGARATTVASGTATGGGSSSATCKQLTAGDAQPLESSKITGIKVGVVPEFGNKGQQCAFDTDNGSITVDVLGGSDATTQYTAALQSTERPVAVSGVGDKAIRDASGDSSAVTALKDDVYCSVDIADDGDIPGADHLYAENGHHTDIGDAAFATIAAALATLCNRVFGTGNTTPDLSPLATESAPAPADSGLPSAALPSGFPTS